MDNQCQRRFLLWIFVTWFSLAAQSSQTEFLDHPAHETMAILSVAESNSLVFLTALVLQLKELQFAGHLIICDAGITEDETAEARKWGGISFRVEVWSCPSPLPWLVAMSAALERYETAVWIHHRVLLEAQEFRRVVQTVQNAGVFLAEAVMDEGSVHCDCRPGLPRVRDDVIGLHASLGSMLLEWRETLQRGVQPECESCLAGSVFSDIAQYTGAIPQDCKLRPVERRFRVAIVSPQQDSTYLISNSSSLQWVVRDIRFRVSHVASVVCDDVCTETVRPGFTASISDPSLVLDVNGLRSVIELDGSDCCNLAMDISLLSSIRDSTGTSPWLPGTNSIRMTLLDSLGGTGEHTIAETAVSFTIQVVQFPVAPRVFGLEVDLPRFPHAKRVGAVEAATGWLGRSKGYSMLWTVERRGDDSNAVSVNLVLQGDATESSQTGAHGAPRHSCGGNFWRVLFTLAEGEMAVRTGVDVWTGGDVWESSSAPPGSGGPRAQVETETRSSERRGGGRACTDSGTAEVTLPVSGLYRVQLQHMFTGFEGMRGHNESRPNTLMLCDLHVHVGVPRNLHAAQKPPCTSHSAVLTGWWTRDHGNTAEEGWGWGDLAAGSTPDSDHPAAWQPENCSINLDSTGQALRMLGDAAVTFLGTSRQRLFFNLLVDVWVRDHPSLQQWWTHTPRPHMIHHYPYHLGPFAFLFEFYESGPDVLLSTLLDAEAPLQRRNMSDNLCEHMHARHVVFLSYGTMAAAHVPAWPGRADNLRSYYRQVVQHVLAALRGCSAEARLFIVTDLPVHCAPAFAAAGCPGHHRCGNESLEDVCNPHEAAATRFPVNNNRILVFNRMMRSIAREAGLPFIDLWHMALSYSNPGGDPWIHYDYKDGPLGNVFSRTALLALLMAAGEATWNA